MNSDELVTRATAIVAIVLYGASVLVAEPRGPDLARRPEGGLSRNLWTAGCGMYLLHVACAFGLIHNWSHAAAYEDTARQTAEMTGWRWGGGLWINYAFTAVWCADAAWWWLWPARYQRQPKWTRLPVRGFLAFIVFQASVVFGSWPAQVVGGAVFAAITWRRARAARWLA